MTVLVTGGTGQLGRALRRTAPGDVDLTLPTRAQFDLSNPSELVEKLNAISPSVVINTGAYTDVDGAEENPGDAYTVNAAAPEAIANWCSVSGAELIHISTDFVFDGNASTPYRPEDPVSPINIYGETKEAGERLVRQRDPRARIFRTSWLYGLEGRSGFVNAMLRRALNQVTLSAVTDQTGSPTSALALAEMLWAILAQGKGYGETHHAVCRGAATRYDLVEESVTLARKQAVPIACQTLEAVLSDRFPTTARRPSYSVLDTGSLTDCFGIVPPHWKDALSLHITEFASDLIDTGEGER